MLLVCFFVISAYSQTVNSKYELVPLTPAGASVTSPNDSRNAIKWFSSDKAVVFNGLYYFTASTSANGKELWVTDGTPAGTKMLKDIFPGVESSNPDAFMVAGPKDKRRLYFRADDGVKGLELWATDGTENGTVLVQDVYQSADGIAEDIITPADTLCLECIVSKINVTYKKDTVVAGKTPLYTDVLDTIKTSAGIDSLIIGTSLTEVAKTDTICGTLKINEWDQGLEITQVGNPSWVMPTTKLFPTGYCYARAADTVRMTGNGGCIPFALSEFGDNLLFTAIYEDETGYSSQGLRWLFIYDTKKEMVKLVSDEVQPFPFDRQNDAMRWNLVQPFQVIDVNGSPIAMFMGRHKKYGDEICYTDGIPKSEGGLTNIVLDFNDELDPNNSIPGATKGSATLDWIQKVSKNWVIFRNSTLGKWGGSPLDELDQNPWATNGYQTFLIDDMNRILTGAGTRTSPSYLGDYFMFKGALYAGGQAGDINKQITRFGDVSPQSQETWFINGPNDAGVYGNGGFGKAGYFKDPYTSKEYMFFSGTVTNVRTTEPADQSRVSKFNSNVGYALFCTQGTYEDLMIVDSLSHKNIGGNDGCEQITQLKDKLYMNSFTDDGERELFGFAFGGKTGYESNAYFNVVNFAGAGNPTNVRALGDYLIMKCEGDKKLYALKELNSTYKGETPVYNSEDHLMAEVNSPAWDGTYDYGFGEVVDLSKGQNSVVKDYVAPGTEPDNVFDIFSISKLYPNPATDCINLEIESKYVPEQYSIINMSGQVILKGTFNNKPIDVSSLVKGQYSIGVLTSDKHILVKMFMKL